MDNAIDLENMSEHSFSYQHAEWKRLEAEAVRSLNEFAKRGDPLEIEKAQQRYDDTRARLDAYEAERVRRDGTECQPALF
jgi:hypothetical protein